MLIRKLDPAQFVEAYNVKEQMFYPWDGVAATPFGAAWLVVEPGRVTKPHNHHEGETFFILRGRGHMKVAGDSREVEPGDVIYLPPFGDHELANHTAEDLHFLTVWWEDAATIAGLKEGAGAAGARPREIVTVAGRGAAAGAAAAIHARYARLRGSRVRELVEPPSAAPADPSTPSEAAALALCARLLAAGELMTDAGPAAGLRFDPGRHRDAIERQRGRTAMSPALRTLVDGELAGGLAPVAVTTPAAAGQAASPIPGLAGQRFARWFVRAAWLLAAAAETARPGERQIVFLDPGDADLHAVLLPALAAAASAANAANVASPAGAGDIASAEDIAGAAAAEAHAPAALVDCGDQRLLQPDPDGAIPAEGRDWLRRLAQKLAAEHGGATPPTQAWTAEQRRFTGQLLRAVEAAGAAYEAETFAPQAAARAVRDLFLLVSEFEESDRPWSRLASRREERNTGVALELLALKSLAMIAQPLYPRWSARLLRALGYGPAVGAAKDGMPAGPAAGGPDGGLAWEETPSLVPTGQPVAGLEELAAPARG